ncbi:MAG: hypothetical protein H6Q15_1706 [Bacteroidetes bacterium]|nr:hypothetical protein [Bacteroidota bacterium]
MKNKTKLSTAILIGSAVIGATNCEAQVENNSKDLQKDSKNENQLEPKIFIPKKDSIELEQRLKELSTTTYKGKLERGAMCYESGGITEVDYVCPICGENSNKKHSEVSSIGKIGKIFKEIKLLGYDVVLDVDDFCEKCSGKIIKDPSLKFMIRFSPNSKYHIVRTNIISDYNCLLQFFLNKEKYPSINGRELTIGDNTDVIYKMTGLGKVYQEYDRYAKIIIRDSIELEKRLKFLSETPYTGEFYSPISFQPSSYESSISSSYGYYVCPTCGKETRRPSLVLFDIENIEKIVKQIKDAGYDVVLEQKEFCKYCSGRIFLNNASFVFKIRFSENSDYHVVKSDISGDYSCLFHFLLFRKTFVVNSRRYTIHDNIDIIQKMTGLGSDLNIPIKPKKKKKWYEE